MSLRIIKPGILDTIQDLGRLGYQHLGVNPNGAMDLFSAQLANALLGQGLGLPVLELHFPAAQIVFEEDALISITGADLSPSVNEASVPCNHPVLIRKGAILRFTDRKFGARAYIAFYKGLPIDRWLGSASTNLMAGMGGCQGRALKKDDVLPFVRLPEFRVRDHVRMLDELPVHVLPWKAIDTVDQRHELQFLIGSEWNWLTDAAREQFLSSPFQIDATSSRMGCRLRGQPLSVKSQSQLISAAVVAGTVQLLPDGQLIILMADHQTMGGYPRIAHIITAHLPLLAQRSTHDVVRFTMTRLEEAEQKILIQKKHLEQLRTACAYRLDELFAQAL